MRRELLASPVVPLSSSSFQDSAWVRAEYNIVGDIIRIYRFMGHGFIVCVYQKREVRERRRREC